MAFLSSFRSGSETIYPDVLRQRLRSFPLLQDLSEPALKRLLSQANWFGLPGGTLLPRDGENVGEMSLISGEAHSAQLVALRDSELLRISRDGFQALMARHPHVVLNLM